MHIKSGAKLRFFIVLCKRLRKKNKNIIFYMLYNIKHHMSLARVKKNKYLCRLLYV